MKELLVRPFDWQQELEEASWELPSSGENGRLSPRGATGLLACGSRRPRMSAIANEFLQMHMRT